MLGNPRLRLALVTATVAIMCAALSSANAADDAYGEKDLTFKEIKSRKQGEVEITFTAKRESLYFCPGANAKTTEKGIELTFVRSFIKKKPKVKYPAKSVTKENATVNVITVTAKDATIFLRDGTKLIELLPKD